VHRGKGYLQVLEKVDRDRLYDPPEALRLIKETSRARFDETVEVAVHLGVDPRHADQMVRGVVVLPHGLGKPIKVLVFAKGEKAKEAEEAGADYVGAEDLLERIQGGWLDFQVAIATPDMMGQVGRLGKILGPRGLMPNPKTGTVTFDVGRAVREAKAGRVEYRTDRGGVVHAPIGKVSFELEKLLENFHAFMESVLRARPEAVKGQYIRSVTVSSTMGPGIRVNPQRIGR